MDSKSAAVMIRSQLQPWHEAVANPENVQPAVLERLVADYARTEDGFRHGAGQVGSLADFRRAFPIRAYPAFKPLIERVMAGETGLLLCEPPVGWAITRGTTRGESKFIPMTATDLSLRVSAGRAVMEYVLSEGKFDVFGGVNLNLNFPSVVGTVEVGGQSLEYGYSSGIYTRYVSHKTPVRSQPSQEAIDALGGGKSIRDWERRFDLAYETCQGQNVTLVGGVCPTALRFGKYLKQNYKVYPKDLWQPLVLTLGSVPGINVRYQPALNALYGSAAIREIYGTTEGMFGQQRDQRRAWVPNYDLFFFEVETPRGIKLLHEMHPGEMGGLVVSTPILPRYRIGDLILAVDPPYYRCIGRQEWWTPLRYVWEQFITFNFGRL